jgi:hypothetical protein
MARQSEHVIRIACEASAIRAFKAGFDRYEIKLLKMPKLLRKMEILLNRKGTP